MKTFKNLRKSESSNGIRNKVSAKGLE